MFVDIIGSKAIIEKIGPLGFHHFLNNLIFDITEPIIIHSGTILHYVEDEVVISWSMKKGLTHANCIRTFFSIKRKLEGLNEEYYDKYGFLPGIRAAVHCGTVIRAEVGVVKAEISTVGDVLNTTSRILDECHQTKTELLISGELLEKLELPALYRLHHYSETKLRGKASEIDLFTIERRAHAAI
jgi:adenylate cyclase